MVDKTLLVHRYVTTTPYMRHGGTGNNSRISKNGYK